MKLSLPLLTLAGCAWAIDLNPDDNTSIISAAKIAAGKLRALYPTTEPWFIPGEFGLIQTADGKNDQGYYWWEAGAAMGAFIDYWAFTGDDTYNNIVTEAMLFQVGPDEDYQPPNQTLSLGNDDQAFWAIAALSAAERGFPDPPSNKPQWLALAQAVFNRQASRWDDKSCGGGLRWQVVSSNKGYDYKNAISNGLFFNMGARLGRYTGNSTYIDWAEKVWAWSMSNGLLGHDYKVYDGSHIPECVVSSKIQWSYNAGVFLSGAAAIFDYYNTTASSADKTATWKKETWSLLNATDEPFFNRNDGIPNVMRESACESPPPYTRTPTCNTDQRSFKAYLSRFFAQTYQYCPFTRDFIKTRLRASAVAAAKSCNGADNGGNTCGLSWIKQTYDGSPYGIAKGGVGEHMSAMEVFQSLLIDSVPIPNTERTGTSKGDVTKGSGTSSLSAEDLKQTGPTTTGDRAGAGILTTIFLGALLGLTYWLIRE